MIRYAILITLHVCFMIRRYFDWLTAKSRITKILNPEENSIVKSLIKWQNQMTKHIKRMHNNCHISDLVQAFSNAENGGMNLVL